MLADTIVLFAVLALILIMAHKEEGRQILLGHQCEKWITSRLLSSESGETSAVPAHPLLRELARITRSEGVSHRSALQSLRKQMRAKLSFDEELLQLKAMAQFQLFLLMCFFVGYFSFFQQITHQLQQLLPIVVIGSAVLQLIFLWLLQRFERIYFGNLKLFSERLLALSVYVKAPLGHSEILERSKIKDLFAILDNNLKQLQDFLAVVLKQFRLAGVPIDTELQLATQEVMDRMLQKRAPFKRALLQVKLSFFLCFYLPLLFYSAFKCLEQSFGQIAAN